MPLSENHYVKTDYLHYSLDTANLRLTVKRCARILKGFKFDAIAFRGNSGALVAPSVALLMNKGLILVRKDRGQECHHSTFDVEGATDAKRYIIIDDFVSSGKTVDAIIGAIEGVSQVAKCVGIVCYNDLHGEYPCSKETVKTYLYNPPVQSINRILPRLSASGVLHDKEELCKILSSR